MTVRSDIQKVTKKLFRNSLRVKPLIFLSLFVVSFLTSTFITTLPAHAAITTAASKADDPDWQIKSFLYYRAIASCLANSGMSGGTSLGAISLSVGGRIDNANINNGKWFTNTSGPVPQVSPVGFYLEGSPELGDDDDGKLDCTDEMAPLIKTALSFWGLDAATVLCNIGMDRVDQSDSQSEQDCIDGTTQLQRRSGGVFGWPTGAANFKRYINEKIYGVKDDSSDPGLQDNEWYIYYKKTLANSCIPKITAAPSDTPRSKDNQYGYNNVKWVDISQTDRSKMVITGSYLGAKKNSDTVALRPGGAPNYNEVSKTCAESVSAMNSFADGYADWAFANKDTAKNVDSTLKADKDAPQATSCAVEGIGWILCPVANAMGGITDALFKGVTAFMEVSPLALNAQDDPLYKAWSVMRTIANIAFVIVFLIIIFSQLTSVGVSNYGVKKLLPRLVIGAILVNLSFYICAVAVDLSNILGVGVQNVFKAISVASSSATDPGAATNWASITTSVLTGAGGATIAIAGVATFASGGVWGAIAALLPLLVSALFALVVAFLVLLARQALIIMAIVISPLAFIAFLLPNTEGLFKKWRDLFMSLLVLFPLLSAVFGASQLAATILRNTADSSFIGFFLYIGSFAVQAIPFFITPLLIKLSSGVLGRFAGIVNNPNKGPFDRLRKGGERVAKDAQNRGYARKLSGQGIGSKGPLAFGARRRARVGRVSSGLEGTAKYNENEYINGKIGQTDDEGNIVASRLATRMAAGSELGGKSLSAKAVAGTEQEHLKEAMQPLLRKLSTLPPGKAKSDYLKNEILEGTKQGGDPSRASAALHYAAQIGDTGFLRDQIDAGGETERMTREAINANPTSVIGKAPDLVKGAQGAFGSIKGSDLVQFKPDTAKAYVEHLRKLSISTDPADAVRFKTAIDGFNSAVEDISKSPELQGQFSAEVGTTIETLTRNDSFRQEMGGIAGIQPDGKIR